MDPDDNLHFGSQYERIEITFDPVNRSGQEPLFDPFKCLITKPRYIYTLSFIGIDQVLFKDKEKYSNLIIQCQMDTKSAKLS